MEKIPTAEEFLKTNAVYKSLGEDDELFDRVSKNDLIEFAKLHVEAALKKASNKVETTREPHWSGEQEDDVFVDRDSILNSYPLDNIK